MKKPRILRFMVLVVVMLVLGWIVRTYNFSAGGALFSGLGSLHERLREPSSPRQRVDSPLIIGHRGAGIELQGGRGIAGNTLRSIEKATRSNVDWIEIDVRKSNDGTLFLFHDADVRRVTNAVQKLPGRKDWRFSSLTDDEIARIRVAYPGKGARIPTLASAMEAFPSDPSIKCVLDLKEVISPDELVAATGELDPNRFILFGQEACLKPFAEQEHDAGVNLHRLGYTALWSEDNNRFHFLFGHEFLLQRCKALDCDYLVLPAMFLNQDLIDDVRAERDLNGLKILAYGIDEDQPFKATDMGIDGLIVDFPQKVRLKYFRK